MYFALDENDIVYDSMGQPLYRIVATKNFLTVDNKSDKMIRNVISVKEGEKGGYVGSNLCLEEKLCLEVKPWVFFPACISSGSILSGASIISGNTMVSGGSVIDGGNAISDSVIDSAGILTEEFVCHKNRILLSFLAYKNSNIQNYRIEAENVKIESSLFDGAGEGLDACITGQDIHVINSELRQLGLNSHTYIKDTAIEGAGNMLETGTCFISGCEQDILSEDGKVVIKKLPYTHAKAYELMRSQNAMTCIRH